MLANDTLKENKKIMNRERKKKEKTSKIWLEVNKKWQQKKINKKKKERKNKNPKCKHVKYRLAPQKKEEKTHLILVHTSL